MVVSLLSHGHPWRLDDDWGKPYLKMWIAQIDVKILGPAYIPRPSTSTFDGS